MLISFEPWHLDVMRMPPDVKTTAYANLASLRQLAEAKLAGTIVVDGVEGVVVLGVVGALPRAPGICEVFILATEAQKKYPVEFVKTVCQVLGHAKRRFAKIDALGEDTPFYNRWFGKLGFIREGVTARAGCRGMLMWSMSGEGGI